MHRIRQARLTEARQRGLRLFLHRGRPVVSQLSFSRTGSRRWKTHLDLPSSVPLEHLGLPDRVDLVWILVDRLGEEEMARWNLGHQFRLDWSVRSRTGGLRVFLEDRQEREEQPGRVQVVGIPLYTWFEPISATGEKSDRTDRSGPGGQ